MKKYKYLIIIVFIVIVGFSVNFIMQNRNYNRVLSYKPIEIHNDIIIKLKQNKIPYQIDEKGNIKYQSTYDNLVKTIEDEVKSFYYPNLPNYYISDKNKREYFIELLKQANIQYSIKKLDSEGNEYIVWDWKDDEEVRKIMLDFYTNLGITKKQAKISFPSLEEHKIFLKLLNEEKITYTITNKKENGRRYIEYRWEDWGRVRMLVEKVYQIMKKEGTYPGGSN